jgi:hypothetical protein
MASLIDTLQDILLRNDICEMRARGIEISDDEAGQWIEWHKMVAMRMKHDPRRFTSRRGITEEQARVELLPRFVAKYPDFPALIARLEREAAGGTEGPADVD